MSITKWVTAPQAMATFEMCIRDRNSARNNPLPHGSDKGRDAPRNNPNVYQWYCSRGSCLLYTSRCV